MNDDDREIGKARILEKVREVAQEEEYEISELRSNLSIREHGQWDLTIWIHMKEEVDPSIEMKIILQDVRFYETDPETRSRVDERIRSYFGVDN